MLWLHNAMRMTSTTKKCWNYCFVLSSPVKSWVVIDLRRDWIPGIFSFLGRGDTSTNHWCLAGRSTWIVQTRRKSLLSFAMYSRHGWLRPFLLLLSISRMLPPQTACKIMSDGQLYGCLNVSQSIIFVNQRKKALFITISEWFGV